MKKSSLADWTGYIIFRLAGPIFRVMPLFVSFFLGRAIGELFYCFDAKHRAVAYANLKTAFGDRLSPRQLKQLAKDFYRNFGQSLIEILLIPRVNKQYIAKYVTCEGRQHIEEGFQKGKGVILLGAHGGSWEISNVVCTNLGFPLFLLIREQKLLRLNRLLNAYRSQKGAKLVQRKNQTRQLIQILKNNQAIGMTVDQGGSSGVPVRFFGRDASMASGAVRLALKYDAAIIPGFYVRLRGPYMKIIFVPPFKLIKTGNSEEDVRRNLEGLMQIFQDYISRYPEQYLWFYKIWKYSQERNILILSDGKAGHLSQAQATAAIAQRHFKDRGINSQSEIIEVKFKNRLSSQALTFSACLAGKYHCQGCLWCLKKFLTADTYQALTRKKYDLIISCGSGLAAVNFILSKENLAKSVVLMRPSVFSMQRFDLVIIPRHDQPARQCLPAGRQGLASFSQSHRPVFKKNTVLIEGALNLIDEDLLKEEAALLKSLAKIDKDLVLGMLIGGDNKDFRLSRDSLREVISQVKAFLEKNDALILVTTSRRTPKEAEELVRAEFSDYPRCRFLVIANEKNLPFAVGGILGASRLVITSPESISMISEAVASRRYVLTFAAAGVGAKHKRFLASLIERKNIYISEAANLGRVLEELWEKKPEIQPLSDNLTVSEALKRIL